MMSEKEKILETALTITINNILELQGITKDSPEYEYRFVTTWNAYIEQAEEVNHDK